jgi:hypothetical protein
MHRVVVLRRESEGDLKLKLKVEVEYDTWPSCFRRVNESRSRTSSRNQRPFLHASLCYHRHDFTRYKPCLYIHIHTQAPYLIHISIHHLVARICDWQAVHFATDKAYQHIHTQHTYTPPCSLSPPLYSALAYLPSKLDFESIRLAPSQHRLSTLVVYLYSALHSTFSDLLVSSACQHSSLLQTIEQTDSSPATTIIMLATMRPAQHYPQGHINDSRSTSRNSNHSNTNSPSLDRATPSNLSRSNSGHSNGKKAPSSSATAGSSSRSTKKASQLSNEVEVEAIKVIKPGLITLSKPLNGGGNKASAGIGGAKAPKASRKKKGPALLDEIKGNEEEMLSRSAPASSKGGQDEWDMPAHRAEGSAADAPLNWQQEMIASTPDKKKPGKKAAGSKNNAAHSQAAAPAKDSLTWQQELLGANKPRGPTFDVFADARDVATFGGTSGDERRKEPKGKKQGGASSAGNRKRAGSVGEIATHLPSKPSPSAHGLPSIPIMSSSQSGSIPKQESAMPTTPNGKFAYAGPNFHNSPSPASLPVPKFLQQRSNGGAEMTKSGSTLFAKEAMMRRAANDSRISNDGDTSTSSEEREDDNKEMKRSIRGVTAPPEMQTENRQSEQTIESLLAKMLSSG